MASKRISDFENATTIVDSDAFAIDNKTSTTRSITFSTLASKIADKFVNVFQSKLTFDTTPTNESTNPVTSNGIYQALQTKVDTEENKSLVLDTDIAQITTNKNSIVALNNEKVNKTDIVDNLTSTDANKPLSAKQGKVLKDTIDSKTVTMDSSLSDTSENGVQNKVIKAEIDKKVNKTELNDIYTIMQTLEHESIYNAKRNNPGLFDSSGNLLMSTTAEQHNADYTFRTIPWSEYKSSISEVVIPDGTVRIGNYNFSSFTQLTAIYMAGSIKSIGYNAFQSCSSLTEIYFPYSLETMSDAIFGSCNKLEKVHFHFNARLETIGNNVFQSCSALKEIILPDSVTTMGTSVFGSCSLLEYVKLPKNLTSIPQSTFSSCSSLKRITMPDKVKTIETKAFESCRSLEIVIPSSVTTIGTDAFKDVPHIYYNGTATGAPWGALAIN